MHIDASQPCGIQYRFRQQQSISRYDDGIGFVIRDLFLYVRRLQFFRRVNGQFFFQRPCMYRTGFFLMSAIGGARGLGIDGEYRMPGLHQRFRDVRQGPDGNIYALTDQEVGALLKIEPAN